MNLIVTEMEVDDRKVWYRVEDFRTGPALDEWERPVGDGDSHFSTVEFPVISETPKGVWIDIGGAERRFVLRDARKRYACPTEEEAMQSFIARKTRQLSILHAQERHVQKVLRMAQKLPVSA